MPLHPLHVSVAGYGLASAQILGFISPTILGEYLQVINIGLMVIGSTLIVLWQRKRAAIDQVRRTGEEVRHDEVLHGQAGLAVRLDDAQHAAAKEKADDAARRDQESVADRELLRGQYRELHADQEVLRKQIQAIAAGVVGLTCPFAADHDHAAAGPPPCVTPPIDGKS